MDSRYIKKTRKWLNKFTESNTASKSISGNEFLIKRYQLVVLASRVIFDCHHSTKTSKEIKRYFLAEISRIRNGGDDNA
ncbi:hypothetical protein [Legionella feeleii]|uniref:Uncharacterized protein n=1 Tax=Legionella feeleii TaxID=453 RepID=A0A378IRG4_9GAMM|nr:hypothetical protein [Legionella feeleii]STX37709.1 Uncharacterised protein [Legionella feeleii]